MSLGSVFLIFFFFKQKTAYELRISDWSSDVCSSDLCQRQRQLAQQLVAGKVPRGVVDQLELVQVDVEQRRLRAAARHGLQLAAHAALELAPVAQAGQRIVRGLVAPQLGELALLGPVAGPPHQPAQPPQLARKSDG